MVGCKPPNPSATQGFLENHEAEPAPRGHWDSHSRPHRLLLLVPGIVGGAGPLHVEPGLWIAGSRSARMPQPRLQEDPGQTR